MGAGLLAAARRSPSLLAHRLARAGGQLHRVGVRRRSSRRRHRASGRARPPARPRRRRPGSDPVRARMPARGCRPAGRTPAPRSGRPRRRAAAGVQLAVGRPCRRGLAERLGQHVARQPAFGIAHRSLAHQLERHDGGGLLQDQPLEVAQPAHVAGGYEPRLEAARPRGWTRQARVSAPRSPDGRARTPTTRPRATRSARGRAPARSRPPRPRAAGGGGRRARRSALRGRRAPSPRRRSPPPPRAPARPAHAPRSPAARGACVWRCRVAARRTARSPIA